MPVHMNRLTELTIKFLAGTINEEEQQELDRIVNQSEKTRQSFKRMSSYDWISDELAKLYSDETAIDWDEIRKVHRRRQRRFYFTRIAAAFLIIISCLLLFLTVRNNKESMAEATDSDSRGKPVSVTKPKAELLLANGQAITLDLVPDGTIAEFDKTIVEKTGNEIRITSPGASESGSRFNTLTTHYGQVSILKLADGSSVWLNAGSTIHFPTAFTPGSRSVQITGEGYFEVKSFDNWPFNIEAPQAVIQVTGTKLNVVAYEEEGKTKTTLYEGRVTVRLPGGRRWELVPGQEIIVTKEGRVSMNKHADTTEANAWRQENFQFKNKDLPTILKELGRWYNRTIICDPNISKAPISSAYPRHSAITEIMDHLHEQFNIKVSYSNDTIWVRP